jgi:two-component system sensor histidine kinase PilS (NtrC family)
VLSVDGDGRLGYLNSPGRLILTADAASFIPGQPVLESLRARSRDLYDAITRGIADGGRVARAEVQVRRSDGTLFPVGLSTTTFKRPGSDRRLVTAIFTDISDLKRLQEFRLRAERLEAVAALSASLAHEIRNPLAAIRSAVEQLARLVGDDEDDQTLARLVMRESERLNRLLSEFLDFSRVRATKFERLDLTALVRDVVRIMGEQPAARDVTIMLEGDPTAIDADSDLLNRLVSNLLLNAAQALDGPGQIWVAVGPALPGEGSGGGVDRPVKLTVRDDGPGIPDTVRERLFEPFVSGRQGGTGLGLAIVQRAVAAHRGVILVDTAQGVGTTFSIFLPATWIREDRT